MNARTAIPRATPKSLPPSGPPSGGGHAFGDTHEILAPATSCPVGHSRCDTQSSTADGAPSPTGAKVRPTPIGRAPRWDVLRFLGDTLDDIMRVRVAVGNRSGRAAVDLDEVGSVLAALEVAEHDAKLKLKLAFRRTAPEVRAWVLATPGLGEPLMARLLGVIGDPLIATPARWMDTAPDGHECDPDRCGKRHLVHFEPFKRTPGQLLQFCGHGAALRKHKGMTQDEAMRLGNPRAKMLTHLLAESSMKCVASDKRRGSPYRLVYDAGRERYAGREDWTPLHQHNASLRLTGKAILIDLWRVADGQEPHHRCAT